MKSPLVIFLFFFIFASSLDAQTSSKEFNLVFYNLENLFDTYDDPTIIDEEFLPRGDRHWTKKRFEEKLARMGKVILSSCKMVLPDVIGVCEVENRYVLEKLIENTPLKKFDYKIIHKDSPDARGIDVALLYRESQCEPIRYEYIPVKDVNDEPIRTREILYATFKLDPVDTLHVFFNHWPSRYGGQMETEEKRAAAARCLLAKVHELQREFAHPKIVIMGDFNDEPSSPSMKKCLHAQKANDTSKVGELVNLSENWKDGGTLKHQQSWAVFDQVIVSDYLLQGNSNWCTKPSFAEILDFNFLLEPDLKFQGQKLFRTYNGFKYNGGFSDHLPVRLRLFHSD